MLSDQRFIPGQSCNSPIFPDKHLLRRGPMAHFRDTKSAAPICDQGKDRPRIGQGCERLPDRHGSGSHPGGAFVSGRPQVGQSGMQMAHPAHPPGTPSPVPIRQLRARGTFATQDAPPKRWSGACEPISWRLFAASDTASPSAPQEPGRRWPTFADVGLQSRTPAAQHAIPRPRSACPLLGLVNDCQGVGILHR